MIKVALALKTLLRFSPVYLQIALPIHYNDEARTTGQAGDTRFDMLGDLRTTRMDL